MKKKVVISILVWFGATLLLFGQGDSSGIYFFKGNDVVFEFDLRKVDKEKSGELDFSDLDIYQVAISGDWEGWRKEDWTMQQVDEFRFRLRKPLADFKDAFPWDFRFVVNGKYEIEPVEKKVERQKVQEYDFWEKVFGWEQTELRSDEGNAYFYLAGYEDAEKVILAGSFNHWDEEQLRMDKVAGGWEIRLQLSPDRYEYKFIVDGEWMHDPANSEVIPNIHGTLNSIRELRQPVKFILPAYPNAKKVYLAGDFNAWKEKDLRMKWENNAWRITLPLVGGKHQYKFIVDGEWMVDPNNPIQERDWQGNVNSVLMVE